LWDVQQIGRELKSLRSYLEREFELLRNQSVQERCSAVSRPPLGFAVPDARVPTKDSNPCTHITNTEEAEEDQIDPISPQTSGTVRVSRLQQIFRAYEEKNFSSGWTSESGQGCLKDVVLSSAFSCIMVVLIFINVIILGVEVSVSASLGQEDVPPEFLYANAGFMAFFLLEIGLRILALGCHDFWWGELATWNRFDCVVVSLGSVDLAVSFWAEITAASLYARSVRMTHILRVAHALRSVRIVRFFRYRTPLKALVLSIFSTVMPLIWTLVLLLILLYSFSIVLTQLVVDDCRHRTVEATGDPNAIPICAEHLQRHWSTVPESMNSLFMGITGGIEWDELMRPLRDVSVAAVCSLYVFILIERHQIVAKFRKLFADIGGSERVTLNESRHKIGVWGLGCSGLGF
ncbi:CAC, partial [Symbiodinium microadriaticum]